MFNHSVVVMQNILNPRAVPGAIQVEPLRGSLFVRHTEKKPGVVESIGDRTIQVSVLMRMEGVKHYKTQ